MDDEKPDSTTLKPAPAETAAMLGLLRNFGQDETTSQRAMARDLGIAVGLVNAYVKRCVAKGWLKVSQIRSSNVIYMLTPKGFAEKARLTSEFLSQSLSMFREARQEYESLIQQCQARQWRRVVFYGCSEMSDIALLCARNAGIEPVAVIDPGSNQKDYMGIPVIQSPTDLTAVDAVIVTAMWKLPEIFDSLHQHFPDEQILTPSMLQHLRRRRFIDEEPQ